METWKKWLPDVLAVVLFALISFAYFFPADIEGKILYRHDSAASKGLGREMAEYKAQTGEVTRWMNSVFSGMPTYQSAPEYTSTKGVQGALSVYHLFLPENVWYVFAYLLGFYILLRAFDFRQSLAVLGSIIWAFSTYFLIIIAAGHIWKVMALAYLPPMIAGVVLSYRGKYLWGFIVTAIFSAFEVNANHVQMTYYFLFVILFMIIAYLVDAIRKKELARFGKATAVCAAGAVIGICLNLSNLYHTWEYSKETMRGKSELVKKDVANQTSTGLDRDYITQWSYGIDETWTLLVPNTKGGASVPLVESETAMKHADPNFAPIYQQLGQYWGEQPGTQGPVYVGAFVLMLFILGLFIVKGPMKWALLAATVLSVLLAWGKNFMPFTNFFIDYVPMYAKFRTVASILVIAEFTIPLLAMLALKKIVDEPEILTKRIKTVYLSFGLTGGIAILFALFPTLFFSDFISSNEMKALMTLPQEYVNPVIDNLRDMREAVFTADCWRSALVVVIGTLCLLLFKARKLKANYMVGAIIVLCLIDLWQVNKRYLNNDMFVPKSEREAPIQETETDRIILQDKTDLGNYRVLNLASNTFNENETSYFHNSIGGYHAAKLRRYQDMIDMYIAPEMGSLMQAVAQAGGDMSKVNGDSIFPVLNMLNARYFILPLQDGQTVPVQNPYVYGPAWYVDNLTYVDNANAEIERVGKMDIRHEAVADKRFEAQLKTAVKQDSTSVVKLTSYMSDRLTYDVNSSKGGVIVFSEVYYPGWTATVDGQPVELGRVNYLLRAVNVAPGKHKIELAFHPKSVTTTETIAYVAYAVLLLAILLLAYIEYRKKRK
ncbi:YfhO family protein [Marseilla massiliensis]|uniref:YfhO family protein n=1 Tax=Marseilla massiliensis TaxID=1841864 RepID=A0A938WVF3_9BACT|nr:YfhO family protein [Marseilla massiliensis]MBM6674301.1 YfhO family protein [Marseilla massiliensis]